MTNASSDPLARDFLDPPMTARPRVWWHWMNGNVTPEGIRRDIEWMKRVGIGGLQNFDAALATPQIVEQRLAYMTAEWKAAFGQAVEQANAAGLEFAIASSPGWSETGGPWVKPEDGIKKYVWGETTVEGGRALALPLAAPPMVSGPFQGYPMKADPVATRRGSAPPTAHRDTVVLAFPSVDDRRIVARRSFEGAEPLTIELGGGRRDGGFALPLPGSGADTAVRYDFDEIVTLRSATLAFDTGATTFGPGKWQAVLEVSEDGRSFRPHAEFPSGVVPQYTISFPAVGVRSARIVLQPLVASGMKWTPVEGAVPIDLAALFGRTQTEIRVDAVMLSERDHVHRFEEKAGFEAPFDYYALDGHDVAGIDPQAVVDLTDRLRADGTLDWTPPPGRWTILRFGWSLTGKENHPATAEATGLEVDKYDGEAVGRYVDDYLATFEDTVGAGNIGHRGIRAFLNDSIEVGSANWTPKLMEEFARRRGYDMRPWMPVLAGTIVGSTERSEAFLYDFRRTLAELIAENHYGVIARKVKARGMRHYAEALEFGRPSLGDDMAMRSHADVPMAALWTWPEGENARPVYLADMRGAASVANLYGQNVAAVEALTSALSPWAFAPRHLRPMIDLAFASGINLPVIHTSVHQPVDDKKPGLSLAFFGQFFNRHETWAEAAKPWIDYMARCSFLLQQGRSVASVLYFHGEEAPLTALYNGGLPSDAPRTHDYDFCNSDVLLNRLSVESGDLVATSGRRYRLLWLGGQSRRMTVPTLRRVVELVREGATIAGERAMRSPSLADDPAEFGRLSEELWGPGDGIAPRTVGRGRVLSARDAEEALAQLGAVPDLAVDGADSVLFKHRLLADGGHIYFLSNRADANLDTTASFGVVGFRPERWDVVTGRVEQLSWETIGGTTQVPLVLGPAESVFVVFRERTDRALGAAPKEREAATIMLDDGWTLSFPHEPPVPAKTGTWTADPAHRYFSGTVRYTRTLRSGEVPATGDRLLLDLGDVGDLAEILIDGRTAGVAWTAPWRIDVTGLLAADRDHQLELRVTNRWINRLIGDAQPGAEGTAFTTIPTYLPDAPLRPSGLLGPVRLVALNRSTGA